MKAYYGIFRISCMKTKGGCLRNLRENIKPGCMDCSEALTEILNLEHKVIFKYRSLKEKTGKRIRKK